MFFSMKNAMEPHQRFHPIKDDFREPWSRDRDRVVHSRSFRILEYKTQVFINTEGDYFRTRLTHSIEVSQIARTVAKHLGLNETLCEVIALSHDLGHTPFGHAGGDQLDKILIEKGNPNGFDHNFQSFRVVTKLEKRYKDFDGLNLTFATLEGILKHSKPYRKRFIPQALAEAFDLERHPSLEAVVVDLSDEVAYISHDIDDAIEHGMLDFDDLRESELAARIFKKVEAEGHHPDEDLFRYRFTAGLISYLIDDLLSNSTVVSGSIPADEPLPIRFSPEVRTSLSKLKKMMFDKVYRHEKVFRRMYQGRICITKLFEAFTGEPSVLPEAFRDRYRKYGNLQRTAADCIASLSDRSALELYRQLY